MNNLIEIQAQINALQKQAAEIKSRDFDSTVKEIQETMQLFGITVKNIQAPAQKLKKTKESAEVKKLKPVLSPIGKTVEPKYRGPEGQTWSGRGISPKWLAALMACSAKREDFLIKKESSEASVIHETPAVLKVL